MKKIIALLLVICMAVGMVISTSAANSFAKRIGIIFALRNILSTKSNGHGIGELEDGALTVYVSADGKNDADGTAEKPFATIEAASRAIGLLDKANYTSIDVIVGEGIYLLSEAININENEGGTEACTVRYIGDGNVKLVGGVAFTASDFSAADGDTARYFSDAVRDKIVMIDLKQFGYTPEQITALMDEEKYIAKVPALSANGVLQTLCRYPNEGYILTTAVEEDPNIPIEDIHLSYEQTKVAKSVYFPEEHLERINSWHDKYNARIHGNFTFLWFQVDTKAYRYYEDEAKMVLNYSWYDPLPGRTFFWYNVPEELDLPGEYYIDENAVLYYYPTEDFENTTFTLPISDGIINVNGDYITLQNLKFESSLGNGITVKADYFSIIDCEISAIAGECALQVNGSNLTIKGNHIHDCRRSAVVTHTGGQKTLTNSNSIIYNNHIHHYGISEYPYTLGIGADGVGIIVSHNEIHDSNTRAIYWEGAYVTVEYNHVYNVLQATDDIGAISSDNRVRVGNVIRYNYIHNIGAVGELANLPDYAYMGCAGIYGDFGASYYEVYGNIIESVNGNGIQMGGRGITVRNNLIIDCSNWYVWDITMQYAQYFKTGETDGKLSVPDYVYSPVWKEANPDLAAMVTDLSQTTHDDPHGWAMPADNVIQNNWVHFNKAIRYFTNWGIAPYSIEDTVYTFSADTIDVPYGSRTNENVSAYSSRREDVDLEKLITETAAGFVDMDMERFAKIGRVMDEWNLD
ncbi:MAG: right-handed parallel beta-helix repeat-containing protein [Ruminococcaceae bacterium]|nr:right-handed parallel beta-helix repeat-containing protein [Oscillospiraceae bacterium]